MSQKDRASPDVQVRAQDWVLEELNLKDLQQDWVLEELNLKDLQDIDELLYPLQWHCAGVGCGCGC
ncbi:MAG: hypothetical protein B1H40_02790 [Candidatus Latescibacteria bacterium 4484_181]|nr:MAG: hypothetical protein B1H40_02790 [Candidatus Latescibacteria bacterium 4484_181]